MGWVLMGLFKKQQAVTPVATELDEGWFVAWANDVQDRKGIERSTSWFTEHMVKCAAVIDHDCRDYVQRYCEPWTHRAYSSFYDGNPMPWDLVSFVVGCPTREGGRDRWSDFVVGDVKNKIGRFGDIIVDPTIAQ
jgi:hypothetical protein